MEIYVACSIVDPYLEDFVASSGHPQCPESLTTGSGRGSRLAGFDALFNMESAECKIE